ncbi:MAG: FAD-binding protein [Marmoricola sp.]
MISRRGLLMLGAGGAAAGVAGCGHDSPGTTGPTRSPGGPVTSHPGSSVSGGPSSADWRRLARSVQGQVHRPGTAAYDVARLTENPRYDDARPLAVLTVTSAADVATALAFAADHRLPVAVRSGGHSYPGWSAGGARGTGVPRSLVIDCRGMSAVTLDGTTATIGAGAALAGVYAALAARGRAIPGGSCATVGLGGLTLGGGVGVLTRALGLTCDAVTALEVVTADRQVRRVDADHEPDLFWALRGGGGGHLGVVTRFTFATSPAPSLHTFYLSWPISAAASVIAAWQAWAPHADPRLWSTMKTLGGATHPTGPTLLVAGTWTGPGEPDLSGLLAHCPPPKVRTTSAKSYGEAMRSYAGCSSVPAARCHTGPGGDLDREAFGATSHVGYRAIPAAGIQALLDHVADAGATGLKEAGISMDALGGKVRDLDPGATAFVHREALMTVQYTATFTGDRGATADRFVRGFRSALTPWWGQHAYVNYADPTLEDPSAAYFGDNARRLAAARATYDPDRFFTQPQDY